MAADVEARLNRHLQGPLHRTSQHPVGPVRLKAACMDRKGAQLIQAFRQMFETIRGDVVYAHLALLS